ncbi:MAG: hypothetical protein OEZ58_00235 [Gammaproteobacteria bacterium]|nr:hypothetical protein [Gammaproteobacteria bacterium]
MRFRTLIKIFIGVIAVSFTLADLHSNKAVASVNVEKPNMVSNKSKTEGLKAINSGISTILYFGTGLGVLGLAFGAVRMTPGVFNNPEKGKEYIRGSLWVIGLTLLFEMIVTAIFNALPG